MSDKPSPFERVGVVLNCPKMLKLEIHDPAEVFEDYYYIYKADVDAFLKGTRKTVSIFKMKPTPEF